MFSHLKAGGGGLLIFNVDFGKSSPTKAKQNKEDITNPMHVW